MKVIAVYVNPTGSPEYLKKPYKYSIL